MGECSSRNTVQFLDEIDRNHEFQEITEKFKRQPIAEYLAFLLIVLKEKKYIYYKIYVIFNLMLGNCLNFLLWVKIFVIVA